ncbi:unnamed protein product, partial [Dovyalis caffra]
EFHSLFQGYIITQGSYNLSVVGFDLLPASPLKLDGEWIYRDRWFTTKETLGHVRD